MFGIRTVEVALTLEKKRNSCGWAADGSVS